MRGGGINFAGKAIEFEDKLPQPLLDCKSPACIKIYSLNFILLQRARATTKKIETPADVDGFPDLNDPERQEIKDLIKECITSKPPSKTKKVAKTVGSKDISKSAGQCILFCTYIVKKEHFHVYCNIITKRPYSYMMIIIMCVLKREFLLINS